MRVKAMEFVVIFLFVPVVFGQTAADQNVGRTFYFTQAKTPQEFQEATTAIRNITNIQQASADDAQKSLTLQGTADQIVLAQWLYNELDQIGASGARQCSLPGKPDDVTRVTYPTQPQSPQDFVEAATMIRSIANVPQFLIYYPHRAVVMRGSAAQIALASWLYAEVDKNQFSEAHEYQASDGHDGENVVRMFYLKNTATPQDFVEAVTLVRSISNLRLVFTFAAPRIVAMRGTAGQIALATWLLGQVDKPAQDRFTASEYTVPENGDDVVRVLYIAQAGNLQDFTKIATHIRTESKVQKLFSYYTPKTIAVRGTSQQVALAEQLSRE